MTSCPHRSWFSGEKHYGENIPFMARGHYLPDDAPGFICLLLDSPCGNLDGNTPEFCAQPNAVTHYHYDDEWPAIL